MPQQEQRPIIVMLVDDQPGYRRMVRLMLEREPDFRIVAEASDGSEAVALADQASPDVIVMDVQMPVMGGFEAARRILDSHDGVRIVMNSMEEHPEYPRLASALGPAAFVPKRNLTPESLRRALREIEARLTD